ncbi:type VI secretion system-associated FHA domain protein TagH [Burkholderia contaminans]|uniref:type VI secretion system-associated FHA domain protein TagH n=1 Tax=Burkholderia contaminans TaxID=488447 RepID=UPI001CF4E34F|nr:type VI secretion system-associated FHA domain protein TagH [Burkholderia contaminans]MCA7918754.1 type VI secretion system-associated FHA domain protein TagH [Burkholderia contaminans]UUX35751.1 type VI secretion system-associated FHA domain protein TagH [Burkholderia contaminans]
MNTTRNTPRMALAVENPQALQLGSASSHTFGVEGGTIGAQGATWILADRAQRVQAIHCEILFEDGGFVVLDRSGETRINDHQEPLGFHACVALSEGDRLHIGPYRISVNLNDDLHALADPSRHLAHHDVGELLPADRTRPDDLPERPGGLLDDETPPVDGLAGFRALSEPIGAKGALDPLTALDAADDLQRADRRGAYDVLDRRHYGMSLVGTQPNLAATRFEAVAGQPTLDSGGSRMSQHDPQTAAAHAWLQGTSAAGNDPAQLVAPLVEGMAAAVGHVDTHGAYRLQAEAGQALKAVIMGLMALHEAQVREQRGVALHGRTLQPIEDNPLRLGQSYAETIQALFSGERSAVHLTPAAAVEESLGQLGAQQRAMLTGIEAGLDALLQAFSPEQMRKRFQRYSAAQGDHHDDGAWSWRMFVNYYDELASARQQGFHKLFWEVFDQHYDRALRAEMR